MKTYTVKIYALGMLLLSLFGCEKNGTGFEPEIINQEDNSSFQVTDAVDVTEILEYTWANTGTKASITQSTDLQGGTIVLKVYDADDTQVYSNSIDNNGTFQTSTGTPGTWRIEVTLTNYSGTINFTVQRGG